MLEELLLTFISLSLDNTVSIIILLIIFLVILCFVAFSVQYALEFIFDLIDSVKIKINENPILKEEIESVKRENQALKEELEYFKDAFKELQNKKESIEYQLDKLKKPDEALLLYRNDIINKNINFYEHINNKFSINGIEVELDFNVCLYNNYEKDYLTSNVKDSICNALSNQLPSKLQYILRKEGIKIYLKDRETIELTSGIRATGYYLPSFKEIHIGLRADKEVCIRTVYHEIGHFIDKMLSDNVGTYYSENDKDTKELFELNAHKLTNYATTDVQEFIAVGFEYYLYDKNYLNDMPLTRDLLEKYILDLEDKYSYLFTDNSEDVEYEDTKYDYLSEFVEVEC